MPNDAKDVHQQPRTTSQAFVPPSGKWGITGDACGFCSNSVDLVSGSIAAAEPEEPAIFSAAPESEDITAIYPNSTKRSGNWRCMAIPAVVYANLGSHSGIGRGVNVLQVRAHEVEKSFFCELRQP